MEEYAINYIDDVKLDNWPRRRGPYLTFLTYFVNFDTPEWILLEQVDDCEDLSKFLSSEQLKHFLLKRCIWILLSNILKELML